MFVLAFSLGFNSMKRMYLKEKVSIETLETMLFYIVISTLIGARLGHVLFYDWAYYQNHLVEIFLPISRPSTSSVNACIFSRNSVKSSFEMLEVLL